MSCRFILSDVDERQVAYEEGYSIFEPTVALELDGKNVFRSIGLEGAKVTIVMAFREQALSETVKMIDDVSEVKDGKNEYSYHLQGTGFGFKLERSGSLIKVFLTVGRSGSTQGVAYPQVIHVGSLSVKDWVEAVSSLSRYLSNMFFRLNPETHNDPIFQRDEKELILLEEWLGQSG